MHLAPRRASFWTEPWFLTLAVILGQYYGVWWMTLGSPAPRYVPASRMVVASVSDAIEVTIEAPGLPGGAFLRTAN